ncbi:DUF4835 family protein [Zhouia sp. PK063]|uniref:type IX secretion system protein PorD n=1 Tax=Zhouia sp. PK063 TaxID=3373602 RepID=UPI0037A3381D
MIFLFKYWRIWGCSFFLLLRIFTANAQELNCKVTVNSDLINQTNQQIFTGLEKALNQFVNQTKWTNKKFAENERINCNMLITVTSYESDRFTATLQIQSNRPVYNSTYESSVFNHKDRQFNFQYSLNQPLYFNQNSYDSNLTSVISFYVYILLGIDADTFQLNAGDVYYDQAQRILALAQNGGAAGWQQADGNNTRWQLLDNLRSNTFKEYRIAMYSYHRQGLDLFTSDPKKAKENITQSLSLFEKMNARRPNSFLQQVFFNAKKDEVKNVFSGGPKVDVVRLKEILNKVAPVYAATWREIQY